MFMGEVLCLGYWFWKRRRARSGDGAAAQPLLAAVAEAPAPPAGAARARQASGTVEEDNALSWRSSLVCVMPTVCDLSSTTLSGVGLLFTTASVCVRAYALRTVTSTLLRV